MHPKSPQMNIREMKFGSIDARNEFLARDAGSRQLFFDSFILPPSFDLDELINGNKFIICGPKGSGKTALLRFLHQKVTNKGNSPSKFIVFRDDVSNQDKDKIVKMSGTSIYTNEPNFDLGADVINAWQIFVHREIAEVLQEHKYMFALTNDMQNYFAVLNQIFTNFRTSKFKTFLSTISKGKFKVGKWGAAMEAEFEFVDSHGSIDTSELARYLNSTLSKIDFAADISDSRVNIFLDEINITYVSGASFSRDSILIRDLIAACGKMNLMFSEKHLPIYIYTAIRTEVVDSVQSSVRELRKWIDDSAVHVDWYQNVTHSKQPIIQLVQKRIAANLKVFGFTDDSNTLPDWFSFFEPKLFDQNSRALLLFNSWGRPRDIVRMLSAAAKHVPIGKRFNSDSFRLSQTEYSKSSWEEKRDELNTKYSQSSIDSIKRILAGCNRSFSYSQFTERCSFFSRKDNRVNQFVKDRNMIIVLEDMFKVGILGNVYKNRDGRPNYRYLYNGLQHFDSELEFCIHRSLWIELGLIDQSGVIGELFEIENNKPKQKQNRTGRRPHRRKK